MMNSIQLMHLHQTNSLVATSVLSYSWKTTEWTECRVDVLLSQQDRRRGNQTGLCGGGIQTREVYCVQTSSDTPPNLGSLRSKEGDFPSMLFFYCLLLLYIIPLWQGINKIKYCACLIISHIYTTSRNPGLTNEN